MTIPFVDLKAQTDEIKTGVFDDFGHLLHRSDFVLGHAVERFEASFAQYTGCLHCVGVASGLDALRLALRALGIGPGDEVVTVSHTFIATVLAISSVGARPVLVDVDPAYYTMDPSALAGALTSRTKAVVPVHLYGQCADMDPILETARAKGLHVIEDAAQAHGAHYRGRPAGSLADAAAFSFYPGKNLGAFGDGGAVTCSTADVASTISKLRNYGARIKYNHEIQGENSRLDTLQALVLQRKLDRLDCWNRARIAAARLYRDLLKDISEVMLPEDRSDALHVYHLFVIQVDCRDALHAYLQEKGVQTMIHYPVPVHMQPAYEGLQLTGGSLAVTEKLCTRILSLPIFPHIKREQIEYVADTIRAFFRI